MRHTGGHELARPETSHAAAYTASVGFSSITATTAPRSPYSPSCLCRSHRRCQRCQHLLEIKFSLAKPFLQKGAGNACMRCARVKFARCPVAMSTWRTSAQRPGAMSMRHTRAQCHNAMSMRRTSAHCPGAMSMRCTSLHGHMHMYFVNR
eukprot:364974-Chlamydomonas_euryale.AAC.7